ncbi:MAG: TIGR03000 domain-containing protein [Gemmataceae bacterium]|nr:TIGR03000 domain-containing protein [Gemmataceae bacterium]
MFSTKSFFWSAVITLAALFAFASQVEALRGHGHGHGYGHGHGGHGSFGIYFGLGYPAFGYSSYYSPYWYSRYFSPFGYSSYFNWLEPAYIVEDSAIAPPGYVVGNGVVAPAQPNVFAGNYCRVLVRLPDPDAEVWLEGNKTNSRGMTRVYETPELEPGSSYSYTIRASWVQNGRPVTEERRVSLTAGRTVVADFNQPPPAEKIPAPSK